MNEKIPKDEIIISLTLSQTSGICHSC